TRGKSDPGDPKSIIPVDNASNQQLFSGRRSSLPKRYNMDWYKYLRECEKAGIAPISEPWNIMAGRQIEDVSQAYTAYNFTIYRRQFRNVTPRELKFLEEFETKLKAFVDDPLDNEKKVAVQTLNGVFHSSVMLFKPSYFHMSQSIKAVRDFARITYLTKYGDYMADTLKVFRVDAKAIHSEGIQNLQGLKWTDVHDKLEKERAAMRRYELGCQRTPPPQYMTNTIKDACDKLVLDYDNMEYCIQFYSDRNKACHNMVSEKVARCDWEALGRQLYLDRDELTAVFQGEQQDHMIEALDRVAKRYFNKVSLHKSEPSLLAQRLKVEMADRIAKKERNKLIRLEQLEKKDKKLASLQRKKNRVKRQLEKEKSSKKAARA
ncbi:MAG: hypothetical protein Q9192_008542, partial [Flavoplaca navasiana]